MNPKVTCLNCRNVFEVTPEQILRFKTPNPRYLYTRCPSCGFNLPLAKSYFGKSFVEDCLRIGKQ